MKGTYRSPLKSFIPGHSELSSFVGPNVKAKAIVLHFCLGAFAKFAIFIIIYLFAFYINLGLSTSIHNFNIIICRYVSNKEFDDHVN